MEHGAALIMIFKEYFSFFADTGACDKRMTDMAKALGMANAAGAKDFVAALDKLQIDCGVDALKMSDYGVKFEDLGEYARNARETMGGLFEGDP
jgi:alcohol dehydrogenase